jgi:hypothetical protein
LVISDSDRRRIAEEERIRAEARDKYEQEKLRKSKEGADRAWRRAQRSAEFRAYVAKHGRLGAVVLTTAKWSAAGLVLLMFSLFGPAASSEASDGAKAMLALGGFEGFVLGFLFGLGRGLWIMSIASSVPPPTEPAGP